MGAGVDGTEVKGNRRVAVHVYSYMLALFGQWWSNCFALPRH